MPGSTLLVPVGDASVVVQEPDAGSSAMALGAIRTRLQEFSRSGDARFLRYAKAAFSGLANTAPKDLDYFVLKARILQAEHDFTGAADVLQRVLSKGTANSEAQLLLADSLQRAGEVRAARGACLKLALQGEPYLAEWCARQVQLAYADAEQVYQGALPLLDQLDGRPDSVQRWGYAIIAEAAVGANRTEEALNFYDRATADHGSVFATRLAHADLLLRAGRPQAALDRLRDDHDKLAAVIRIAIAHRYLGLSVPPSMLVRIDTALAAPRPEPDEHLLFRDRAIYEAYFRVSRPRALQFALANWQGQKGSADLELLETLAQQANAHAVLAEIADWRSSVSGAQR